MNIDKPIDLVHDQLRDLYSVESQVILTMPELARQANHPALRKLLQDEEARSLLQKERLQQVADRNGFDPSGDLCKAMKGLIEGGNAHLAKAGDPLVKDLLLIAHCNRIKHYELAGYSYIVALADGLGSREDAESLRLTFEEEREFAEELARQATQLFGIPLETA